ncbi:MAG: hypothetical protein C5B49_07185 [Bdellovibrio sp.]|nr:MAG: hypothetical protein C5B49_07185 [Bdellovibrio sp.]
MGEGPIFAVKAFYDRNIKSVQEAPNELSRESKKSGGSGMSRSSVARSQLPDSSVSRGKSSNLSVSKDASVSPPISKGELARALARILLLTLTFLLIFQNCGPSIYSTVPVSSFQPVVIGNAVPTTGTTFIAPTGLQNTLPIVVGNCGFPTQINIPCVTVTICVPGSSQCATIPNVLLDTGSFGLRVFQSQVAALTLPKVVDNSGNQLAECAPFVVGTDWGPVRMADVQLGGSTASNVPIQVIDSTFPGIPSTCTDVDTSPAQAGFNGILGVGQFIQDCGSGCTTDSSNGLYFLCSSTGCTGAALDSTYQVSNPVSYLSSNNNGVIVQLPAVGLPQQTSIQGTLILGIGTNSNNGSSGANMYQADASGNITTNFNGQNQTQSTIDSGTNGYSFGAIANVPVCPANTSASGLLCPASDVALSATIMGANGKSQTVSFQVGNATTILSNGYLVANDFGLDSTSFAGGAPGFTWGLPFFFGRTIYVGFEGRSSTLGTGPYWAF